MMGEQGCLKGSGDRQTTASSRCDLGLGDGDRAGSLTNTGCHGRTALLEARGAAVTGEARNAILARTLARGLVTGFASGTHWMAVTS